MGDGGGVGLPGLDDAVHPKNHTVAGLGFRSVGEYVVLPQLQVQPGQQLPCCLAKGGYRHFLSVVIHRDTLGAADGDFLHALPGLCSVGIVLFQSQSGLIQHLGGIGGEGGVGHDPVAVGDDIGLGEGRLAYQRQRQQCGQQHGEKTEYCFNGAAAYQGEPSHPKCFQNVFIKSYQMITNCISKRFGWEYYNK